MEENIKYEDAVAFFKYTVILPLLEAKPGTIRKTAKELSQKVFNDPFNMCSKTIGERTIFTYYSNYKKYRFDGLKPKVRPKNQHPSVSDDIVKEILKLKEELPTRSAEKIITMLSLSNKISNDALHPRTVNRILNGYGYTKERLKKDKRVYVKHEKHAVNVMWESDIMEDFYIPDGNGGKKLVYAIGFIDDHSRRITHCQFYFESSLTRLEDCLKKAVIKSGAPSSLYVDNGKVYVSDNFKIICAKLGIKLKYATPYKPAGKGKIEKYWQFVQSSFVSEIRRFKVSNIIELNDMFSGWLENEYHNRVHSSLGETPIERWNNSIQNGAKLRFFTPVELDEIFLHEVTRTVNNYGVVSFEGNTYEIDGSLVGYKVTLRYNPFHLETVHVYYNNKYFGPAGIIDLNTKKHRSVKHIEEDPLINSEISRRYLSIVKSNYQEYLNQQIATLISKDVVKQDADVTEKKADEKIFRAPTDKKFAIERSEFIDIVTSFLSIDNLTFSEKGKLYELYETFKEFNKDILVSILEDMRENTQDFNKSFLYYLVTLKNQYNEQIEKLNMKNGRKSI